MTLNIYESQLEKMRSLPNRFQIRASCSRKVPRGERPVVYRTSLV